MCLQHGGQVDGLDRLAPLGLQAYDVGSVGSRHAGEPLTEVAAHAADDPVTG